MTDDPNKLEFSLLALNKMLGGFPPDFEQQPSLYQLTWLQHHIPQLQQEIVELEAQTANIQQQSQSRLAQSKANLAYQLWIGNPTKYPPPAPSFKPSGFWESLGSIFEETFGAGQVMTLKAKKDLLLEMQIREKVLAKQINPSPTTPKAIAPPPAQQRAQIQAEIAAMLQEKANALAAMAKVTTDQMILQGIARGYDDKIQKLIDKL
jgi:TolA-binding protein